VALVERSAGLGHRRFREKGSQRVVNDRPTTVVELEPYVDARELARLMGVSERTIARMVVEGMPSETWGLKRTRRFQPSRCIAWASGRMREPRANATRPTKRNRRE
jgi:hypothetical protein